MARPQNITITHPQSQLPTSPESPYWPNDSGRNSMHEASRNSSVSMPKGKRRFKSYRLRGPYEKPWLNDPNLNKTRYNNWIVTFFIVTGFILAGLVCFFSVRPYQSGPVRLVGWPLPHGGIHLTERQYCLVFEDDFKALDTSVWSHMVEVSALAV